MSVSSDWLWPNLASPASASRACLPRIFSAAAREACARIRLQCCGAIAALAQFS